MSLHSLGLVAEGRQPVTFGGWSEMRRLLPRPRQPRHREAKGHRPGSTTRALPSMAGRGQGERGESLALGGGNTALPCRRKHGPDSQKSPRWSAERRGILRQDAAASRKGADIRCACRRSAPLTLFGEGAKVKGAPGAFQIIRAAERWLFDK